MGVGATQWAESRHRAEGQTDGQRGLYLRSSVSRDRGRAMGEGGISHHESPKKARDGVEMASRGGPHAPAQPGGGGGRQQGVGAPPPHHHCLMAPAATLPNSPLSPQNTLPLCTVPSAQHITVLRPPCFPGGPRAQPHSLPTTPTGQPDPWGSPSLDCSSQKGPR